MVHPSGRLLVEMSAVKELECVDHERIGPDVVLERSVRMAR